MCPSVAAVMVALGYIAAQAADAPKTETEELAIARGLDIDYRDCAVVVLSDQIRQLTDSDTAYISIMGADPDGVTLAALRKAHLRTTLGSQAPHTLGQAKHSHTWSYNFVALHAIAPGEYVASTGFYCGRLCAAAIEYRLKKNGHSCSIVAPTILWQA